MSFEHPHHHNLYSYGQPQLLAYDQATTEMVDRSWHMAPWQPVRFSETNYFGTGLAGGGAATDIPVAVMIHGTPGETFQFEYVEHWELIGSAARGKTPNETFDNDTRSIISAFASIPSSHYTKVINGVLTAAQMVQRYRNQNSLTQRRIMY